MDLSEVKAKLIPLLLNHSIKIKPNDKVLIECNGLDGAPLVGPLVDAIHNAGGTAFVHYSYPEVLAKLIAHGDEAFYSVEADWQKNRMERMDCWIGIRAILNRYWDMQVPTEKNALYNANFLKPVHLDIRVKKRWVLLNYPTQSLAQSAEMDFESYWNFWLAASTIDYPRLSELCEPLYRRMANGDQVRIVTPGAELTFSIKGIGAKKCVGECNIPDGEVFSAPVLGTVEGELFCGTPNFYEGTWFNGITLTFKNGEVIEADCQTGPVEKLRKIIFGNPGARVIGEFALGFNKEIKAPTSDALFTEKIAGSFHTAFGFSYPDCGNGNQSTIHWDIITILRPEYGGGKIFIDDELIMEDGKFAPGDLLPLNFDN